MLILAGVTLNAAIGDNGIISQAQYATFLNEMAAVEEAVAMWKINQEEKLMPTSKLCESSVLDSTERLVGEVGYYRTWSIYQSMPDTNILSDASTFNNKFQAELLYFPAGVQDLYYLDNDAIGIKSDKVYLIDLATSMIYSLNGISLKGVRCYSADMAQAVMNGTSTVPLFAQAESDDQFEKLAGNSEAEYGFEIVGHWTNSNLYKLYNNGDLYGKGEKGALLNTSPSEMENINGYRVGELEIPSDIPGYNTDNIEIIPSFSRIFVIDSNKELWAWGSNSYNLLGLTETQQISYSGYEPIKLNVDNKQVYKVFPTQDAVYVVTIENGIYELYASGNSQYGQLGTGFIQGNSNGFEKVEFTNPQNITNVVCRNNMDTSSWTIISANENGKNVLYYAGTNSWNIFKNDVNMYNVAVSSFSRLTDNSYGNIDSYTNISNIFPYMSTFAIISDNTLYSFNGSNFVEVTFGGNSAKIIDISSSNAATIAKINIDGSNQIWYYTNSNKNLVGADSLVLNAWTRIDTQFTDGLTADNIKSILSNLTTITNSHSCIYYLTDDGEVYGSGVSYGLGLGISDAYNITSKIIKIDGLTEINEIINKKYNGQTVQTGSIVFKSEDGKLYMTGNPKLLYRDKTLEKSWSKMASNVKVFNAQRTSSSNCMAYIDNNNDLWVLGNDMTAIGLSERTSEESIQNFVLFKDYYKDSELYSKISGHIVDYGFAWNSMYFLTDSSDGNKVYVVGIPDSTDPWCGYDDATEALEPKEIISGIKSIHISYWSKFLISNSDELYYFGRIQDTGFNDESIVPKKATTTPFDVSKIEIVTGGTGSYILEKTDTQTNLYGCGYTYWNCTNGISNDAIYEWTAFDNSIFGNEKIKQVSYGMSQRFVLTESGKLYGWGSSRYLGINSTDVTNVIEKPILLDAKGDIESIVVANGYGSGVNYGVCIRKDGSVWGTGENTTGTLGRWKGGDRNTANSRYQTAFEWVECPDLEI